MIDREFYSLEMTIFRKKMLRCNAYSSRMTGNRIDNIIRSFGSHLKRDNGENYNNST
jgi:hypothetical protein